MKNQLSLCVFSCLLVSSTAIAVDLQPAKPNIVIILADDLGYGDVQCYNLQQGKIATPNIDRLASQGMRFTDGHSSSGVCSPTRYTLLTGRYHWRSRLQAGIVEHLGRPLIAKERLTIAGLTKQYGYRTAAIGKWHLGWDWNIPPEQKSLFAPGRAVSPLVTDEHRAAWNAVFSRPIQAGPTTRGFDEYFGTDVPNQSPYCFIENDRTVGIPSVNLPIALLKNSLAGIAGPALPDWKLEGILPALGDRAVQFIATQSQTKQPFFLYMPLTSPHTPIAPNDAWRGKSELGAYADFVMETDSVVGRVLDALDTHGATDNTLVLFTSDNGCAPTAYKQMKDAGHSSSGTLREYKGSVFEGGHRIPFIARWPGIVKPNSVCNQLVHHADFMATIANILGAKLPDDAGEDSYSLLPLLQGTDQPVRTHAVSCAASGIPGLRQGNWKLIQAPDKSAGTDVQLYDLAIDLSETKNLAAAQPKVVANLQAMLEKMIVDGRSTPGTKQANDVEVVRFPVNVKPKESKVSKRSNDVRVEKFVASSLDQVASESGKTNKAEGAKDDATQKPNILFIAVDDLRPDLGCYGISHMHTPNLDRLASRGMLFERAYCQVSVCNPSRSSLLSGNRPETTRVWDNQHFLRQSLPDVVTLPQHFKNHGWRTISLGKIFHHSDREPGQDPISWSELAWFRSKVGREWFSKKTNDELNRLKNLPEKDRPALIRGPPFESADESDDAYPDGQTALKSIETLQRLSQTEDPFFLAVGFVKPHLTFSCPQKYWELYPANQIQLPRNYFAPKNSPRPATFDPYELRSYGSVPPGAVSNELALNLIRGYRSCVSFVDAQIGRVIDELDRLGLRDNTIVIVWGDHGYHLGENGVFTKMTNFEQGTRVPLILSVPHPTSVDRKSRGLVELVDVYPTLAELAELPMPSHLEGTSLVPLLKDPNRAWKKAVFSEYARRGSATTMGRGPETFMGRSIRTDRWRYTEWLDSKQENAGRELYDHQSDALETVNLADDPAYRSIASDLASQLQAGWKAAKPGPAGQR